MPLASTISAAAALDALAQSRAPALGIDVRSEGEFEQGSISGFANAPILNNEERHLVGICYQHEGAPAAIELAQNLVKPDQERRISLWESLLPATGPALIACWRGGLRSSTAAEWLAARGKATLRVVGGYKALRRELLAAFESLPPLLVICGPTGSGKTKLLEEATAPLLNLEDIACHRGSAFGQLFGRPQPAQASFENSVAMQIRRQADAKCLLVEDESQMVGKLCLPKALLEKMAVSPVVRIHMGVEARAALIVEEYVHLPVRRGVPAGSLLAQYEAGLQKIGRKLGGAASAEVLARLRLAFREGDPELHRAWVQDLLVLYYDKVYEYSFRKRERALAFEGDWNACREWLQKFV